MKRPQLVHFLAIKTEEFIAVKASVTMKENLFSSGKEVEVPSAHLPIQAIRLLGIYEFSMKVVGLGPSKEEVYKKTFDSDSYGNFYFKIPLNEQTSMIEALQIYEVKRHPGLELHLGTYIPLHITPPKKIIICDFDKTLVETRYSTTKEVYYSLTKPLKDFPTIQSSVDLLKRHIREGFHPFILSASPHFYEEAIRNWLYQNEIFTAGIFLKDYRRIFSFLEEDLTPKDLKVQGLYKMGHLLDILTMTGVPDELILVGDNFESDPIIYLTLSMLIQEKLAPWPLWHKLKEQEAFKLNNKQDSKLLNKVYQVHNALLRRKKLRPQEDIKIKIYIRKKSQEESLSLPLDFQRETHLVSLYEGNYSSEI